MGRAPAQTEPNAARGLSLLRCEELARYAIDRLHIEDANCLSPHDRARLASAAAILKELCEVLTKRPEH
ncbi:MAG: hypothetical protein ABIQ51_08000 [Mesorhizobium sp.]